MPPTADTATAPPEGTKIVPRHMPGTTSANIVATPQLQDVKLGLTAIRKNGGIIAIDGKPGLGKTFASDLIYQTLDLPRHWVTMPFHPKGKETTTRIHTALTGSRINTRYVREIELLYDITDILAGQHLVLAIDEAQHLTSASLNQLRYLYDDPHNLGTRLVLVLIGAGLEASLQRNCDPLQNRVDCHIQFSPYSRSDMVTYLASYHPLFANSTADAINAIVTAVNGNLRLCALTLKSALSFGFDPAKGMRKQDVDIVIRFMGSNKP